MAGWLEQEGTQGRGICPWRYIWDGSKEGNVPGAGHSVDAPRSRALLGQIAWFLFYPPPTLAPPPRLHPPPRLLPEPSPLPALRCALTPAQSLWTLPLPPPLMAQDLLQLGHLAC